MSVFHPIRIRYFFLFNDRGIDIGMSVVKSSVLEESNAKAVNSSFSSLKATALSFPLFLSFVLSSRITAQRISLFSSSHTDSPFLIPLSTGLVHYALTHGQPINSLLNGVLPIHAAASSGNEQVLNILLEFGADVNSPRVPRRHDSNALGGGGSSSSSGGRGKSSGIAVGTAGELLVFV